MRKITIILLAVTAVISSCDRTRSSTGWDYMPDMYYSEAYETYTPNENFRGGQTMQVPAPGSVPRGFEPFPYSDSLDGRALAGQELVNPVELNDINLKRGETMYTRFCLNCHGETGDGRGYLFTSRRYPLPPASLIGERAVELADGEIYHSITAGYQNMGPHGAMIPSKDRWTIVHYIREVLQK